MSSARRFASRPAHCERFGRGAACVALLLAGCSKPAPPKAPPPPEVGVVTAQAQPVPNIVEVPGRLQAVRTAEVRARVDGVVRRRLYQEGTDVRAGQPLFSIDPREPGAQLSAALAVLARAEATAANARQDVARYEGLVKERAVSRQDYDAAVARLRTAEADVAPARAQVEAARLTLAYTTVTARIAGRAGRAEVTEGALVSAAWSPLLTAVRPEGQEDAPQLRVQIDRVKARALGLAIGDVNATLAITFGSAYANDFTRDGRILRVLLATDAPFRMTPQDVLDLKVRNAQGEMVPFGAFTSVEWTAGPPQLQRYNGCPSMTISGTAAPGRSTGEAMDEMERLAAQLPQGFAFDWTGISYEEKQSAGQVGLLLGPSLVVVFLLLSALYESWAVPLAVLLVVPLGVLGSVLCTMFRGMSADVFFNVGLITIIGLAAKNATLIVEFAIEEEAKGKSILEATLNAVKLRLRPIIMTSLAFILGMVPLVIATGAGAASRRAVGTGVAGGMISATLLGVFFIPLFYLSVRRWISRKRPPAPGEQPHPALEPEPSHA
jgi:multidrug efflux pump subunit AcrB